jgi:hypothetical protein
LAQKESKEKKRKRRIFQENKSKKGKCLKEVNTNNDYKMKERSHSR